MMGILAFESEDKYALLPNAKMFGKLHGDDDRDDRRKEHLLQSEKRKK